MSDANETLSEREKEILRMVASGAPNKEIARQLVISPNTVKVHLRNIFAKIGVSSRTEATLYALRNELVTAEAVRSGQEVESAAGEAEIPNIPQTEDALPATVETASATTDRRQAAPTRRTIAAVVLVIVLLAVVGVVGSRLLRDNQIPIPTPQPAGVANARWHSGQSLPAPRKAMGVGEYDGDFYLIGGETEKGIDGALLRYRASEGRWETLTEKPTPVSEVQVVMLREKLYVPGGLRADGTTADILEVYDPRQDRWEPKAKLPQPVHAYAFAAYEGRMYLFGGKNETGILDTVYSYDPEEDRWQTHAPMTAPRAMAAATVVGGKILIIGGSDGARPLARNEGYFPNRENSEETAWESYADLPEGRYGMGAAHLAGIVFVVGGLGEGGQPAEPAAIQYLSQSNQWAAFETPPQPVGAFAAVVPLDDTLFVLGGETPEGLTGRLQNYQALYTVTIPLLIDE